MVSKVEFGENVFVVPISKVNYICWSGVGSFIINFVNGHTLTIGNPEEAELLPPQMIGNLKRCFDSLVADLDLYHELQS